MKIRFAPPHPNRKGASNGGAAKSRARDAFGRPGASADGYYPADLGCPDCRGVLYVAEVRKQGFLSFRCRVGHVFSAESLLEFKEDRLDEALWTSLELCDELIQLHAFFSKNGGGRPRPASVPGRRGRLGQLVRQRQALKALTEGENTGASPRRPGKEPVV